MAANYLALTFPVLLLASIACATDTASVERGRSSFQEQCTMCHAAKPLEGGDQGPPLNGVVGRKAGSFPGFTYSNALKASDKVWTPSNLDRFLADPPGFIPGTKMPVNVGDADDRADIIAFLNSTTK
jgi:cytochrome c